MNTAFKISSQKFSKFGISALRDVNMQKTPYNRQPRLLKRLQWLSIKPSFRNDYITFISLFLLFLSKCHEVMKGAK